MGVWEASLGWHTPPPQNTLSPPPLLCTPFPPERPRLVSWAGRYLTLGTCAHFTPHLPSAVSTKAAGSLTAGCGAFGNLLGSPAPHVTAPRPRPGARHPHLEQHARHRGGPCGAETVVGGAGVLSQDILVPQGDDQRALRALGPAGELEGSESSSAEAEREEHATSLQRNPPPDLTPL